jgi:hypothetical protein
MAVRVAERRDSTRVPAAYAAALWDTRGCRLGQGRTANISQSGVYIVARARPLRPEITVIVELQVPALTHNHARRNGWRTVRYRAQVVRVEEVGNLWGIALQLGQKLA